MLRTRQGIVQVNHERGHMTNNIKAYRAANHTLDSFSQLVMLYDKAIASVQQAKEAISEKDIEKRYNRLERAFLIVTGLRDVLDMDKGGEVAATLKDWYTDVAARILSINTSEDISMADLCVKHLKEMKDAWLEAKKTAENESDSLQKEEGNKPFLPDISLYFNAPSRQTMALSI